MGRKASGKNYRGADGFYRQDDRSGFTVRASQTKQEWTSAIVDGTLWEPRNAQDFVRGVKDNQTVSNPRPLPNPTFDGPIYVALSANAAIGATFLTLASIAGLTAGDRIGVMTNLGVWFNTTINGAPVSTGINISNALTSAASSGNLVVDKDG